MTYPVAPECIDDTGVARAHETGLGGSPWPSLPDFLRLTTNPRVFPRLLNMADVWNQIAAWLASGLAWVPGPTERHGEILARFIVAAGVHGNLVPDAHLAALTIEHGLELNSMDGDFARTAGLKWRNTIALHQATS